MEIAKLVLEYVRVVAWPLVALVVLGVLSPHMKGMLDRLSEASWGGATAKFASAARQAEEQSIAVKETLVTDLDSPDAESYERSPAGNDDLSPPHSRPPRQTKNHRLRMASALQYLLRGPDFDLAREIADTAPDAAVLLAFKELEALSFEALTAVNFGRAPSTKGTGVVREASPATPDARILLRDLIALRNSAAHNRSKSISVASARDYIDACENLGATILHMARSRLRHPSRVSAVIDLADEMDLEPSDLVAGFRIEEAFERGSEE